MPTFEGIFTGWTVKGHGFIAPDGGGEHLVVHQKDFRAREGAHLRVGEKVKYDFQVVVVSFSSIDTLEAQEARTRWQSKVRQAEAERMATAAMLYGDGPL
jgi:hypothetical protein